MASSSLGAAILGLESLGQISDLTAVKTMIELTRQQHPNPANVQTYQELYPIYEQLIAAYQPIFKQLEKFK